MTKQSPKTEDQIKSDQAALETALDAHFDKKAKQVTPKQIEEALHKRFPGLKDKLIVI